jgi:hypothetical protein
MSKAPPKSAYKSRPAPLADPPSPSTSSPEGNKQQGTKRKSPSTAPTLPGGDQKRHKSPSPSSSSSSSLPDYKSDSEDSPKEEGNKTAANEDDLPDYETDIDESPKEKGNKTAAAAAAHDSTCEADEDQPWFRSSILRDRPLITLEPPIIPLTTPWHRSPPPPGIVHTTFISSPEIPWDFQDTPTVPGFRLQDPPRMTAAMILQRHSSVNNTFSARIGANGALERITPPPASPTAPATGTDPPSPSTSSPDGNKQEGKKRKSPSTASTLPGGDPKRRKSPSSSSSSSSSLPEYKTDSDESPKEKGNKTAAAAADDSTSEADEDQPWFRSSILRDRPLITLEPPIIPLTAPQHRSPPPPGFVHTTYVSPKVPWHFQDTPTVPGFRLQDPPRMTAAMILQRNQSINNTVSARIRANGALERITPPPASPIAPATGSQHSTPQNLPSPITTPVRRPLPSVQTARRSRSLRKTTPSSPITAEHVPRSSPPQNLQPPPITTPVRRPLPNVQAAPRSRSLRKTTPPTPITAEHVPSSSSLLGLPPSPGSLGKVRKQVYHLSLEQVAALQAAHNNNPGRSLWSSGVFERLREGKRAVPRGTIKITVELPAGYAGMMPRDLLVRDHAELERNAGEDGDDESDDESDEESDDDQE